MGQSPSVGDLFGRDRQRFPSELNLEPHQPLDRPMNSRGPAKVDRLHHPDAPVQCPVVVAPDRGRTIGTDLARTRLPGVHLLSWIAELSGIWHLVQGVAVIVGFFVIVHALTTNLLHGYGRLPAARVVSGLLLVSLVGLSPSALLKLGSSLVNLVAGDAPASSPAPAPAAKPVRLPVETIGLGLAAVVALALAVCAVRLAVKAVQGRRERRRRAQALWDDAVQRHDVIRGAYGAYRLDPVKRLARPELDCIRLPETAELIEALEGANAAAERPRAFGVGYLAAVERLELAWTVAQNPVPSDVPSDGVPVRGPSGVPSPRPSRLPKVDA